MVGYDGGRVARRGARRPRGRHPLGAHPADPGGAGERLPRAPGAGRMSVRVAGARAPARPGAGARHRPGGRLPPVRLPARRRAGARAASCSTTPTACCSRSRATAPRSTSSSRGWRPRRRRWRCRAGRGRRAATPAASDGFAIRREPARRGRRRAGHARQRDLRGLPARAVRPGRPPLPLPVHQLHQLRPAVHDRPRDPVRPPAARRWPAFAMCDALPGASTRIPATGASTPSRTRAPSAGRRCALLDRRRAAGRRR